MMRHGTDLSRRLRALPPSGLRKAFLAELAKIELAYIAIDKKHTKLVEYVDALERSNLWKQ